MSKEKKIRNKNMYNRWRRGGISYGKLAKFYHLDVKTTFVILQREKENNGLSGIPKIL